MPDFGCLGNGGEDAIAKVAAVKLPAGQATSE